MSVGDSAGEAEIVELQTIVCESTEDMFVVELTIAEDY
jgi:hypothetical protein